MRSYNREFGRYWGYGGFGGALDQSGPVLGSFSVGFGIYPEKTGTQVMTLYDLDGEEDELILAEKSFDGWGLDFKYQFHAFLTGKVDEAGPFIRWGSSLHLALLDLDYDVPDQVLAQKTHYVGGRKDKVDFYFEGGLGYQFDLGFTNLDLELHAGIPVFTTYYRSFHLLEGGTENYGSLVDMDDHQFGGMPFYWGLKAGILI